MKYTYVFALAAALVFGCSSSNKNTRTTASNDQGTTQSGSISGTSSTAGTQANAQGTATVPNSQASTANTGTDVNAQGSATAPAKPSDTSSSTATAGSTAVQNPSAPSGQSTYGQGSSYGASGSVSGSDTGNLRTVTGSVAKVDQNSITLDQSAGGVTLTVDSQTQIIRRGQPIAAGISAIHEGQQVRASFDPASNRADKIEVMGKGKAMKHQKMGDTSGSASGSIDTSTSSGSVSGSANVPSNNPSTVPPSNPSDRSNPDKTNPNPNK